MHGLEQSQGSALYDACILCRRRVSNPGATASELCATTGYCPSAMYAQEKFRLETELQYQRLQRHSSGAQPDVPSQLQSRLAPGPYRRRLHSHSILMYPCYCKTSLIAEMAALTETMGEAWADRRQDVSKRGRTCHAESWSPARWAQGARAAHGALMPPKHGPPHGRQRHA